MHNLQQIFAKNLSWGAFGPFFICALGGWPKDCFSYPCYVFFEQQLWIMYLTFISLSSKLQDFSSFEWKTESLFKDRYWYHCYCMDLRIDLKSGVQCLLVNLVHFNQMVLNEQSDTCWCIMHCLTLAAQLSRATEGKPVPKRISDWLPSCVCCDGCIETSITYIETLKPYVGWTWHLHFLRRSELWQQWRCVKCWTQYRSMIEQIF